MRVCDRCKSGDGDDVCGTVIFTSTTDERRDVDLCRSCRVAFNVAIDMLLQNMSPKNSINKIVPNAPILTILMELVKDHRAHCHGPDCQIMLSPLIVMFERAGIQLTAEERRLFA